VAHTGERRDAHRMFMGKTEGNRPGCRWENDIKMDLKEISRQDVDQTDIAQDRGKLWGLKQVVSELSGSFKCGVFLDKLMSQLASKKGLCSMF